MFLKWLPFMQLGGSQTCNPLAPDHANGWIPVLQLGGSRFMQSSTNLHLLFWLSLVPFTTGWAGEAHFSATPALFYGIVLFMAAIAYFILQKTIIASQGINSVLKKAIGNDWKGKLSPIIYMIAFSVSFWSPYTSFALYVLVALIWVVPERRVEDGLGTAGDQLTKPKHLLYKPSSGRSGLYNTSFHDGLTEKAAFISPTWE